MKKTLQCILMALALEIIFGIGMAGTSSGDLKSAGEMNENLMPMQIHFIDVGQGDSTLVICGTDAMLIDAGNNDQGTKIQRYLQKQGVEKLRYVICTHPDADHIGGMDVILYKYECETILMTDDEADTNTYRDVADTMKNKGYAHTLPLVGQSYTLGDAEFTIVGPVVESSDNNSNSIAILLTHGENRFLFTGDAEEEEEKAILGSGIALDADVYKAGHHGSRTSSSKAFLEAVSPAYAVISCGENNEYGHPHSEVLNNFRAMDIKVFRTDEQGSIIAYSDGRELTWNCGNSENWKAGEPIKSSEQAGTQDSITYICNTNTKKFHVPSCSSVQEMKEKNKWPVSVTREALINMGYEPCKKCKP